MIFQGIRTNVAKKPYSFLIFQREWGPDPLPPPPPSILIRACICAYSGKYYDYSYIVTGELHVPLEVCGAVVKRELDYWQINENHIKSCCWRTYRSYIENKRILDSFNRSILREHRKVDLDGLVGWKRFQTQVWMFLEYPRTSRAAMVSTANAQK